MNFVVPAIFLTSILCISVTEGFIYNNIIPGCWRDKGKERVIDSLEGTSEILDGKFGQRENAVEKCAELANSLGFTNFAISRGGECLGSANASFDDYMTYGEADNCMNGKGGRRPRSMDVYYIESDYQVVGSVDCSDNQYNLFGEATWAQNISSCQDECNKHSDCVGFNAYVAQYVRGETECWLKKAPCFENLMSGSSDWKIYKKADINETQCTELQTPCEGDCCYADPPMFDQQQCPGHYNPETGCQETHDYCMPRTYNNSYYAPSLGAAEVCYFECPVDCGYGAMVRSYGEMTICHGKYSDGCDYSFCMPTNETYGTDYPYDGPRALTEYGDYGNGSCPMTCPSACSEFDITCPIGFDENGCSYGDYCSPIMYWDGERECPGYCHTDCDWATETSCPIYTADGCYTGNYCAPIDDSEIGTRDVCGDMPGMRMDENDHMMLRSGSPTGVQNFLKKLRFEM